MPRWPLAGRSRPKLRAGRVARSCVSPRSACRYHRHVRPARLLPLTVAEVLTVVVTIVVLAAIAVPMWRTHELRIRRERAIDALLAVQAAQDQHFASHARYADESHLQKEPGLRHGEYRITIETSDD